MAYICPTCKRAFSSYIGMKVHHKKAHDVSIAGEEYTCEVCGEKYRDFRACRERRHTCSPKCKNKLLSERLSQKVTLTCEVCGKEFKVAPNKADKRRFCSKACEAKWKSQAYAGSNSSTWKGGPKTYRCEQCGQLFEDTTYRKNPRYCSKECHTEALKVRVQATCETCGQVFEKPPWLMARTGKYCNYECFVKDRGESGPEKEFRKMLEAAGVRFEQEKRLGDTRLHADFFLSDLNLVIELDSGYWHDSEAQEKRDRKKNQICQDLGYRILRIDTENIQQVKERVLKTFSSNQINIEDFKLKTLDKGGT